MQDMKNVYEVLRQKEMELARLEKEVEALRLVAPLLSEENNISNSKEASDTAKTSFGMGTTQQPIRIPQTAVAASASPTQTVRAAGWEETAKRWP
jgi:hypothetical protein